MSPDEILVSIVSAVLGGLLWGVWYFAPRRIERFGRSLPGRGALYAAPLVAAAVLLLVLKTVSAHDVRDDGRYLAMYFVLGAAWVGLAVRWLPVTGVSVRDDVTERANASAAVVAAGVVVGVTLCYAGGNVGDGPGWWVVVFSAGLSTLGLFAAWLLLETLTGVSDAVTVDRDPSAGVRLAGFLVACGLLLGRAVAGDWISAGATIRDFAATAWPVLVLVAVAALVERAARPTPERPAPGILTFGAIPALLYVLGAVRQVMALGIPA